MVKNDNSILKEMDSQIRTSFSKVKEELDDHLQALNENTLEVQSTQEAVGELEEKMTKLQERVDDIHMMVSHLIRTERIDLDYEEQKVFLVLYAFEGKASLSLSDIANKSGLEELTVRDILYALMEKGVEIVEKDIDGRSFYKMHSEFKDLQTKEGLVEIDEDVRAEIFNSNLNSFFFKDD